MAQGALIRACEYPAGMMRRILLLGALAPAVGCAAVDVVEAAEGERARWHAARLEKLRAEDGWLTLVGLDFLDDGTATIGRGEGVTCRYENCADELVGTLTVAGDEVRFRRAGASDDEVLVADDAGTPSVIRSGSVSFTLLRRNGRLALRVRDSQSPVRTSFPGIELFAYDPMRVVDARVIEPEPGATVAITNVTGFVEEQPVAAELEFTLAGESARFVATAGSEGRLFVVFGDASNGRETYGAGRFLDIAAPVGGFTTIDFNRATNPPCSFTAFATCPLPPPQNRLPFPVPAGERVVARGH